MRCTSDCFSAATQIRLPSSSKASDDSCSLNRQAAAWTAHRCRSACRVSKMVAHDDRGLARGHIWSKLVFDKTHHLDQLICRDLADVTPGSVLSVVLRAKRARRATASTLAAALVAEPHTGSCVPRERCWSILTPPAFKHIPPCRCGGKEKWDLFEEFQGLLDLMEGPNLDIAAAAIVALYEGIRHRPKVRYSPSIRRCSCFRVDQRCKAGVTV